MILLVTLTTPDLLIRAAAVIGALGVIWGALMVIYKGGSRAVRGIRNAWRAAQNVQKILDQLSPNGGSTLKDQLNRIESRQVVGEQRVRALWMDSANGQFESDASGGTIYINRTYAQLVGMDINSMKGSGWLMAVHPEDREHVEAEWRSAVIDKRELDATYRMVNRETGVTIRVRVRASPLMDHHGAMGGFVGVVQRAS